MSAWMNLARLPATLLLQSPSGFRVLDARAGDDMQ